MNKYSRDDIARCLFEVAMSGHAQWNDMTELNKEDWRVKADAWIQDVNNLEIGTNGVMRWNERRK